MSPKWLLIAAVLGFSGVALGAFGAHGLKGAIANSIDAGERLGWWETAAKYHLVHALAVGLLAVAMDRLGLVGTASASSFAIGVVLFSGSLYVMGATGTRALTLLTPLGGLFLLAGWALLVLAAWKAQQ